MPTKNNYSQPLPKTQKPKTTTQITTNTATPSLPHETQPPQNSKKPAKPPPNPLFFSSSHQTHYPKLITITIIATITAPPNHNHHHDSLKLNIKKKKNSRIKTIHKPINNPPPPTPTVRTYVIHLLGTYVNILCNWLIL